MTTPEQLAAGFEEQRPHLRAVATRILGSPSEADDAVQEAWLRLTRADRDDVANLGGWLTTVVARVSLNMLRARATRREDLGAEAPDGTGVVLQVGRPVAAAHPEDEAVLADSVGLALLTVLDTLTPGERLAFVLHDLFDVSFEEIAPIVGRSPAAARQLASRGRRRVRGGADDEGGSAGDDERRRSVVTAFLAASRNGDFAGLLTLLDPDVVLRADPAAVATGADAVVHGAQAVAATFSGRAKAARAMLVDGLPALVWSAGGRPRVVFELTVEEGRITAIGLLADAGVLDEMVIEPLEAG